jgi:hypothetical protein
MNTYVLEAKKEGHHTLRGKTTDHGTAAAEATRLRAKGWKAHVYRVGGQNESGFWWGWNEGQQYAIPNPLHLHTI